VTALSSGGWSRCSCCSSNSLLAASFSLRTAVISRCSKYSSSAVNASKSFAMVIPTTIAKVTLTIRIRERIMAIPVHFEGCPTCARLRRTISTGWGRKKSQEGDQAPGPQTASVNAVNGKLAAMRLSARTMRTLIVRRWYRRPICASATTMQNALRSIMRTIRKSRGVKLD
jgi:hypothetical protein